MYLGIDIGGTFTDLVLMDEGGNISTAKAPTTPGELEKGVFDAVAVAAESAGARARKSFSARSPPSATARRRPPTR